MYAREVDMYIDVRNWLDRLLKSIHSRSQIIVEVTSNIDLSKFIQRTGLGNLFRSEYLTYNIKSDITGIIIGRTRAELVLIECKLNKISLSSLSQMIGYSRVVKPKYSLIISPKGISDPLLELLTIHNRTDILKYGDNRSIAVARWDYNKKDIDYSTIIPRGWRFT